MDFDLSILKRNRFTDFFFLSLFVLFTFLFYYSSLNNFFVLDDFVLLKTISQGSFSANFHFIPLPYFLYRVLYLFFGLDPFPVKLLNYCINAFACFLVYRISYVLFRNFDRKSAEYIIVFKSFLCGLLFCFHFIHVEAIVYFSELHELLYSMFYLLGFYYYLIYKKERNRNFLVVIYISYLLCLLSKETAISFILCLFVFDVFFLKQKIRSFFKDFHYLISFTFIFALIRYFVFPKFEKLSPLTDVSSIISEIAKNISFAFIALFASLDFTYIKDIYKTNNTNLTDTFEGILKNYPQAIITISLLLVMYIVILLRRDKIVISSFVFILITISSFAWLAGYERYLYLPSAGFCVLFVHYVFEMVKNKPYLKYFGFFAMASLYLYFAYSLKQKELNWIKASEISERTVSQIVSVTKELPSGSKIYFKDLPSDYKGAWILRDGIHEIPEFFVKRTDIDFYYLYEMPDEIRNTGNVFIYDYWQGKIFKQ